MALALSNPKATSGEARPRLRGLVDLLAVAFACYALWFTTPMGALLSRTVGFLTGSPGRSRPLIAYFRTQTEQAELPKAVLEVVAHPRPAPKVIGLAQSVGLDPALARGLLMVTSDGQVDGQGHSEVQLNAAGERALLVVGLNWPKGGTAEVRERLLVEGVAKLGRRLGGPEAAVAALKVDVAQVRWAIDRARAAGQREPERFSAFGPYLPARRREEVAPLIHGTFALATAFDLVWPVELGAKVSSPFGERVHPVLGVTRPHLGVDLAVPTGTPVKVVAAGQVTIAGVDAVNGRFVKVDHGHGLVSAYCHGSAHRVERGDQVAAGRVVMDSGASGRVSGPHLHFQLELDGVPVDPELFRPLKE